MDLPKYAKLENERRFLVDAARCPPLTSLPSLLIEDLYLDGTRLRLRAVTDTATGERIAKLCKKYASDDPVSAPIVNIYLDAAEYAALAVLPGRRLRKRRYRCDGWSVDVFEAGLAGLILAEIEAESAAAVLAVVPPDWAVREVTGVAGFTGARLARDGLPEL